MPKSASFNRAVVGISDRASAERYAALALDAVAAVVPHIAANAPSTA